ncbi:MAG: hypothetical protein H0W40_17130 [Methylibium sp.]|uniref:hypothetical protein n=1 Tax=Methylibium sp. TaxID=2067992 RepID=UPI001822B733|nr:hypothetical protein [Methylibium sp.]MBA3599076.1 hypothetical protein [Methylibium sp.]
MFIHRATLAAGLLLAANAGFAQGIVGNFKGTEKLVVSNCGSYNGTSTNAWWANHSDLDGASYTIKSGTSGSSFSGSAELNGNTSTGKVSGVDKQGNAWTATTVTTLDGDKLSGKSAGSAAGTPCTFTNQFEAARVQ